MSRLCCVAGALHMQDTRQQAQHLVICSRRIAELDTARKAQQRLEDTLEPEGAEPACMLIRLPWAVKYTLEGPPACWLPIPFWTGSWVRRNKAWQHVGRIPEFLTAVFIKCSK